jgi:hypothetical protein
MLCNWRPCRGLQPDGFVQLQNTVLDNVAVSKCQSVNNANFQINALQLNSGTLQHCR